MRIGLTAHPDKPAAQALARHALARIGGRADVVLSAESHAVGPDRPSAPLDRIEADVLIAIGGDGTFLYALRRSAVPLLPINAGTVGVLAEVDARRPGELDAALDRVVEGRYSLEERMKLAADLGPSPLPDVSNDYVVHAREVGKMGLFEIAFDRKVFGRIRADGLILATPTGSTAYSLSSFGPIVDPAIEGIVVTAIAPFRAETRTLVTDPLRTVTVRALPEGGDAVVLVDGQESVPLGAGGSVTVYRSPRRATLVRFGTAFFDRLRHKRILPWDEGFAAPGGSVADLSPSA